jgi:hypothetical protein
MPFAIPLTRPAVPTVATSVLLLLQAPPEAVLLKVLVLPAHNVAVPDKVPASGERLTETMVLVKAVPQLFVTV